MKKKKGFTLIELLAVIVILGIITVIAVPKILDVVNKTKDSAADSSLKLVKDAIKTQIAASDLTGDLFTQESDGCYIFDFDDQSIGNSKKLNIKNKDKITGSIKYCNNTFVDNTLKFDGMSSNSSNNKVICKRATTLHTEECTWDNATYHCSGAGYTSSGSKGTSIITYGNLGTRGTLSSGDAFDCDVNGDGVYDSNTERFYYVSDYYNTSTKSFESDISVLIYYNNVNAGNPDNSKLYAYDSSGENFHGPRTAIKELPTTSQWSNISLKNTTRSILNESGSDTTTGGTLPNDFSYVEYAARFLTVQETNIACKTNGVWDNGKLNSCIYMLENTSYESNNIVNSGYWLENALSSDAGGVWTIYSANVYIDNYYASYTGDFGVRPAIEVSKANMEY